MIVGYSMNAMIINNLIYADDTCIIAPSVSALQELLDMCADFAVSLFYYFNEKKDSVSISNQIHWMVYLYLLSALMMYLWLLWQVTNI